MSFFDRFTTAAAVFLISCILAMFGRLAYYVVVEAPW